MTHTDENLQRYLETNSDEAFRAIVEAHLRVVYSAALRQVNGDAALASDISQVVFAHLATKASTLPSNVLLSGWLYRHTCFTATKVLRAEHRRRTREREAVLMNTVEDTSEAAWEQIAPLLEEGMNSLGATDRNAILLRFFEDKDLRTVGLVLGASDDAAQKRITRAIEKLRRFFVKRGISVSGAALAGILAAYTTAAVPVGLAVAVTGSALAGGVIATSGFSYWFAQFTFMAKLKSIVIGTAVVVGIVTPIILQHQTIAHLRSENHSLQEQLNEPATTPQIQATPLTSAESERMEQQHSDLLRLRAEIAKLRSQQQELTRLQKENKELQARTNTQDPAPLPADYSASTTWTNVGFGSPVESLQTFHWALMNRDFQAFSNSMLITESAKRYATNSFPGVLASLKEHDWDLERGLLYPLLASADADFKGYRIVSQDPSVSNELALEIELDSNSGYSRKRTLRLQRSGSDWKYVVDAADLEQIKKEAFRPR